MNPFQKLRKAVDKATLNYELPQDYKQPTFGAPSPNQQSTQAFTKTKSKPLSPTNNYNNSVSKTDNINTLLLQQQTKYLQQINELSSKNQRLTKALSLSQAEKDQLIQQVCTLEKNNQILQDKIKQLYEGCGGSQDRERKYKQEIYRINKTIQALGLQINNQRTTRKNAVNELNKYKQQADKCRDNYNKNVKQMEDKIKKMDQEIQERVAMLQFNIKKNSEDRIQSKLTIQKLRKQSQDKIQQLNLTINRLKDQLSTLKTSHELLNHKYDTISVKCANYEQRQIVLDGQVTHFQERNKSLEEQLRQAYQKIHELSVDNDQLIRNLNQQRQNIKLKVVEIKDETLELELQMYKRQCKDLLQQKAITQKLTTQRILQPSYQVQQNRVQP